MLDPFQWSARLLPGALCRDSASAVTWKLSIGLHEGIKPEITAIEEYVFVLFCVGFKLALVWFGYLGWQRQL